MSNGDKSNAINALCLITSGVNRHRRAAVASLEGALRRARLLGIAGSAVAERSSRLGPKVHGEAVLSPYRNKYFDLNVRPLHEKLGEEHQIGLS